MSVSPPALVCGMSLLACASVAQAQTSFPNRPITMVVPLPAGGTADLLCRFAADKASSLLGQQVVSRTARAAPAAASAPNQVLRSPPDGYTLLCAPQLTYSITHLVFTKAAFDTRAMEPVSVLATYPLDLIASVEAAGQQFVRAPRLRAGQSRQGQLRPSGQGQHRPSARRAPDAQGQFQHDGNSLSRQRARDQRSARPATSTSFRTICSPTSRTSMPASSSFSPPAAASGSRTTRMSRPSRRRCRASMPIPGWRWRRRPARRRRSPRRSRMRSDRGSRRRICARASWRSKAEPLGSTPEQMRDMIKASTEQLGAGGRGGQDHHRIITSE